MAWVIEKPDGGLWFTPYGWTNDVNRAMTFTTETDALEFLTTTPAARGKGLPARADTTSAVGHGHTPGVARAEYHLYGIDPKTGGLR